MHDSPSNDPQLNEALLRVARQAAERAREVIRRGASQRASLVVDEKEQNDYVSAVDRDAEAAILEVIRAEFPEHALLAEESGARASASEYEWVIDPLDGTTNFLRGIPQYSVSIACRFRGELQAAVVLDVLRDECFTALRGAGAWLNQQRLQASPRQGLAGAVIGTGIPFRSRNEEHLPAYAKSLVAVARQTAGIRRAGSAALDLAYVAAGRFDGFWELGLSVWDVAAGALLVIEAGGVISDFSGADFLADQHGVLARGRLVCAGAACHAALLEAVREPLSALPA